MGVILMSEDGDILEAANRTGREKKGVTAKGQEVRME